MVDYSETIQVYDIKVGIHSKRIHGIPVPEVKIIFLRSLRMKLNLR